MADVYVNSWTEFVSAVAVSGDTVYLPEEAEWDMEEILPWGTQTALTFACTEINGRGTTIKNLHLNQAITVSKNNIIIRNIEIHRHILKASSDSIKLLCNSISPKTSPEIRNGIIKCRVAYTLSRGGYI